MIIYNSNVQLLEDSPYKISFTMAEEEEVFHVNIKEVIDSKLLKIGELAEENQVLFRQELENLDVVVYLKNGELLAVCAGHLLDRQFHASPASYELNIEMFSDYLQLNRQAKLLFRYSILQINICLVSMIWQRTAIGNILIRQTWD